MESQVRNPELVYPARHAALLFNCRICGHGLKSETLLHRFEFWNASLIPHTFLVRLNFLQQLRQFLDPRPLNKPSDLSHVIVPNQPIIQVASSSANFKLEDALVIYAKIQDRRNNALSK